MASRDSATRFERGVADFNAGRFFEAHEVWEELWLAAVEPEKTYLQGLIQVAAAFHHFARGNSRGAQSLLAAGIAKLTGCPGNFRGVAIVGLRNEVKLWIEALRAQGKSELQKLPKIRAANEGGEKRKRGG
jgi:uncharacterized protein